MTRVAIIFVLLESTTFYLTLIFFGRRDILILNFLIFMNSKKLKSFKAKIFIFLLFESILTLTYEMVYFSSVVMEFNYLIKKRKLSKIILLVMSILNILMLTVYSTPQNFNFLCKNIEAKKLI